MASMSGDLQSLKLFIAQVNFSGMKISSIIILCITRLLRHVSVRIVVSAGSEAANWVSNIRFQDSFSLFVYELSVYLSFRSDRAEFP